MLTHEEYVTKLKNLKLIEEKTLEYLAAVRMTKVQTWAEMNHFLGKDLKPKYRIFPSDSYSLLEDDLEKIDSVVVLTKD